MNPDQHTSGRPTEWPVSADGIAYPPEPWRLEGALHASAWLVPGQSVVPCLPQGVTPVILGGKALVLTGWAVYTPGGVLDYHELLCAVAVRAGKGLGLSVTHIWVDSPSSMAGGRELWGIPKQLARFTELASGDFSEEARDDNGPIAALSFNRKISMPGRWPIPLRTVQALAGGIKTTRFRASGRLSFGHAAWRFDETGPLAFLRGQEPLLSVRLGPMAVSFGV